MIPKVLYLYWSGQPLSWLRYLTVFSFKKQNPDWQVKVYYSKETNLFAFWNTGEQNLVYKGKDYFPKLSKLAEIEVFDPAVVGFGNIHEVHKSDLFRLWVLHKYGGVYSDFDILYTKPMPEVTQRWFHKDMDGDYCIGLLAAESGDTVLKYLLEQAKLRTYTNKYQAYGSRLWRVMLEGSELEGWNIPKNLVYSCYWAELEKLLTEDLPDDAVGIHWFGGSSFMAEWNNKLSPKSYQRYNNQICKIIKEIYSHV